MYSAVKNGFTLIELVITVSIAAILAAIAYPNYLKYNVSNSEKKAESVIMNTAQQANKWRAQRLNYQGFEPREGYISGSSNKQINCGDSCNYVITIVDGTDTSKSLKDNSVNGSSFAILAVPKSGTLSATKKAKKYRITSSGDKCYVEDGGSYSGFSISTSCSGLQKW